MLPAERISAARDIIWFSMEVSLGNWGSISSMFMLSGRTPWGTFLSPSVEAQPASRLSARIAAISAHPVFHLLMLNPNSPIACSVFDAPPRGPAVEVRVLYGAHGGDVPGDVVELARASAGR